MKETKNINGVEYVYFEPGNDLSETESFIFRDNLKYEGKVLCANFYAEGDVCIKGDVYCRGEYFVAKDELIYGDQNIAGNQIVNGNQIIRGHQRIAGNQVVSGYQTICDFQIIEGNQTIGKYQTIKNWQRILGNQTVGFYQEVRGLQRVHGWQDVKIGIYNFCGEIVKFCRGADVIEISGNSKPEAEWEKILEENIPYEFMTPRAYRLMKEAFPAIKAMRKVFEAMNDKKK